MSDEKRQRRNARANIAAIMFGRWGVDVAGEAASKQPPSLLARTCVHQEQVSLLLDVLGLTDRDRE